MRASSPHPDQPTDAREPGNQGPATQGPGAQGGRLNLLLSYAGWKQDPWVDRLPRLLEPMGVRSHRAGSGRAASDVIRKTRIHIAVVDLGLPMDEDADSPTEAGATLLDLLRRLETAPPTVVVKRRRAVHEGDREIRAALEAGAFAVVDRPDDERGLELMLEVLRRCMTKHYQGLWPGLS